ncbi:MAG: V-type ATPase subunit, partial [Candidatus Dadabacteria bacterium]|nr:V-type ATPase subunit [Candidatus Dadabacteria bacterium]
EEVMTMYLPIAYHFRRSDAVRLAKAGEDDYRDVLAQSYYGKRVKSFSSLSDLESQLNLLLIHATKKMLTSYPFHIGTIVGYLTLREVEIANLKTIAEGKRHFLSGAEIKENLVT